MQLERHVTWRGSHQQKMKAGSIHPVLRRSLTSTGTNTPRKGSASPERGSVIIGPGPLIRLCLHAVACIASLILGFRFSRETLLVLVIRQPGVTLLKPATTATTTATATTVVSSTGAEIDVGLKFPYVSSDGLGLITSSSDSSSSDPNQAIKSKSSRVHVGRHEILIRPWPHPDNAELYKAHALLQRVQLEQQALYGPKNRRTLIAITPTFARTFQAIHLVGLMHTLKAAPGRVVWIVVEAGGRSNDTAAVLAASKLDFVHLGVDQAMPVPWEQRRRMEAKLRVEGLRYVRREKLDGIIIFADDSNVHSLQLFDEVQKVNWMGALSVGLLETATEPSSTTTTTTTTTLDSKPRLPVQGPACNETCNVIGWHALRASPDGGTSTTAFTEGIMDVASHLEWSGFVIESRLVWESGVEKPAWINEWSDWIGEDNGNSRIPSPLRLAKDQEFIEALGNCGREVMLWWLRVEARADSRYPSSWVLDSPLEVTVPAKRTPWPEYVEQSSSSNRKSDASEKQHRSKQRSTGTRRGKRRQDKLLVEGQQQQQQHQQQQQQVS